MTTQPTIDPSLVYPKVEGIDYELFKIPENGADPHLYQKAMVQLGNYEFEHKSNFLGYQTNQNLAYSEVYSKFLDCQINNIGDPFVSGNFTVNTKFMERAVLDYFASLWNARWPHQSNDPESYWGYVVSMGSSESAVFGFWNARDYLAGRKLLVDPDAAEKARLASLEGRSVTVEPRVICYQAKAPNDNPNMYTPVAFYSQDTHYSVVKTMRLGNIATFNEVGSGVYPCPLRRGSSDYPLDYSYQYLDENGWPLEVPSNLDGTIYVPALVKLVKFFAEKGYPILVNFNYGTTFKGAYDDVAGAIEQLRPILRANGLYDREVEYDKEKHLVDIRNGFWFHVDGALGAGYMPYIEMLAPGQYPKFDFEIPEVCSICMSGHKFLGAPWPCGVYMSKVKYQLLPPDNPYYLGSPDSTLAGSRNGFSAMILWEYLAKHSYGVSKKKVTNALGMARYLTIELNALAGQLGKDLWVEYTDGSFAVRFRKPADDIIFKYSLSGEVLFVSGQQREYNHIYCMEHVNTALIDRFIADLKNHPDPFPDQDPHPALDYGATADLKYVTRGAYVPTSGRGFK